MLQETPPPRVTVANGNQLLTNFICPDFKWEMNKKRFQAQLRVLPLGSYDVVLGVDRLGSLGPVTFNYQELQLQFQSPFYNLIWKSAHKQALLKNDDWGFFC